jgi:hypothetical protein
MPRPAQISRIWAVPAIIRANGREQIGGDVRPAIRPWLTR